MFQRLNQKAGEARGKKVKDKMTPQGKKLFKELQKLAELEVQVGFTSDGSGQGANHESVSADDYENGPTVAEVAAWNEFGTYNIPERPFIRQSVEKNEAVIKAMCAEQLKEIAVGKADADKAIRAVGALQVGLMQHEIITGDFIENAPITIFGGWMKNKKSGKPFYVEGKDSSAPLIDSGRMRQSVHYVVKQKEG